MLLCNACKKTVLLFSPYRLFFDSPRQELAVYCKQRHRIVRDFLIAIGGC